MEMDGVGCVKNRELRMMLIHVRVYFTKVRISETFVLKKK